LRLEVSIAVFSFTNWWTDPEGPFFLYLFIISNQIFSIVSTLPAQACKFSYCAIVFSETRVLPSTSLSRMWYGTSCEWDKGWAFQFSDGKSCRLGWTEGTEFGFGFGVFEDKLSPKKKCCSASPLAMSRQFGSNNVR
jgi:hypothetical protein